MLSWLKDAFEKLWAFFTNLQSTFFLWFSNFFGHIAKWLWDRLLMILAAIWSIIVALMHSFLSGSGLSDSVQYFNQLFHISSEVLGFADAMGLRTILTILGMMFSSILLSWGFKLSISLVRLVRGGG